MEPKTIVNIHIVVLFFVIIDFIIINYAIYNGSDTSFPIVYLYLLGIVLGYVILSLFLIKIANLWNDDNIIFFIIPLYIFIILHLIVILINVIGIIFILADR